MLPKKNKRLLMLVSFIFMISMPVSSALGGGSSPGSAPGQSAPSSAPYSAPSASSTGTLHVLNSEQAARVAEIDARMDFLVNHQRNLQQFANEQRKQAVMPAVADMQAGGAVRLAPNPLRGAMAGYEDGDIAEHHWSQAAEAEKEVQRIQRELAQLERDKQGVLSQSSGCFPGETLVKMEDGSLRPFKQIKAGDRVLTYDIGYDSLTGRTVLETYHLEANHMYEINGELLTTGGERLLSSEGWKTARNLRAGDMIHVDGNYVEIWSIKLSRVDQPVYNMQVDDTHNFYIVSESGKKYLVHNCGGGGGGGGGK